MSSDTPFNRETQIKVRQVNESDYETTIIMSQLDPPLQCEKTYTHTGYYPHDFNPMLRECDLWFFNQLKEATNI